MDRHSIASGDLTATIAANGAELVSLLMADGTELIWQAGPAWPRHAPILFPIVGRLNADTLRHAGRDYRMTQHGFARDRTFTWLERADTHCRLRLEDDAQSRAIYPFAFRLEVAFALAGSRLGITLSVHNPGSEDLPAALGAHPAFAWPLRPGIAREAHSLTFERPEPAPIRHLSDGLLLPDRVPSPVDGRTLMLRRDLFDADALIFDPPASRSVCYTAPGAPAVTLDWEGCLQLGIWSKPAEFVCIEPWYGIASPVEFAGEFADKPGLLHVAPGEAAQIGFGIMAEPPSSHD